MINIYHVPMSRSLRVIWACEELGLEYTLTPVDFSPAYRSTPEWRQKNPVGKVPVMEDGDLRIFESGAMVQYLLDRYGNGALQPATGSDAHAIYLQWSWFGESTFARPLGEIINHQRAFPPEAQSAAAIEEMQARAWLCVDAIDQVLADQPYLLGDHFSAADIMNAYPLLLTTKLIDTPLPSNTEAYWQRLNDRPAMQAAIADIP